MRTLKKSNCLSKLTATLKPPNFSNELTSTYKQLKQQFNPHAILLQHEVKLQKYYYWKLLIQKKFY